VRNEKPIYKLPINGTLDLHTFNPREVKELISDYIEECLKKGIYSIRIIHGKSTGILRKKIHSILRKNPRVKLFHMAYGDPSGIGATIVELGKIEE